MKKIKKLIIKSFLFLAFFIVVMISYFFYIKSQLNDIKVENITSEKQIPFSVINGNIIIYAQFDKNGTKYPFLLDTGADSYIFSSTSKQLDTKLHFKGYYLSRDINRKWGFPALYQANNIHVGNIELPKILFREIESPVENCHEFTGIIGKDIMKYYIWKIDYKTKLITIYNNRTHLKLDDPGIEINLNENKYSHSLSLPIIVNNDTIIVGLDTGSNAVLSINQKKISSSLIKNEVLGKMQKGLFGNNDEKEYITYLNNVEIGNSKINNIQCYLSNNAVNLLGTKFLDNYNTIIIDWENKKLNLIHPNEKQVFTFNKLGLGFLYDNSKQVTYTSYVIKNSIAHNAGIKPNQEVAFINNLKLSELSNYCGNLDFKYYDSLNIVIKNNNIYTKYALSTND